MTKCGCFFDWTTVSLLFLSTKIKTFLNESSHFIINPRNHYIEGVTRLISLDLLGSY